MLSESQEFSTLGRFEFQPVKIVSVTVKPTCTSNLKHRDIDFELNGTKLAQVNSPSRHKTLNNSGKYCR